MIIKEVILFIALVSFIRCNYIGNINSENKGRFKIAVEVVPESDSAYYISWKDTLGQSEGYSLSNRPFEVWCVINDEKDTVGYYRGLSTPADFTYFTTNDSSVAVTFLIGPNAFSKHINTNENKVLSSVTEYNPIFLNLKSGLRKRIEFVLTEK